MHTNVDTEHTDLISEDVEDNEDYIEKCIGAFGVWQLGICMVASMTRYTAISNMLSIIFLTPKTNFICVHFRSNTTIEAKNSTCYKECVKYEYSNDIFEETLISEFGLICDRAWLASFTQTILMLGFVFGVSIYGCISDR